MQQEWINAGLGGVLIGLAVSIMLLGTGRVTGISGIVNGVLTPAKGDTAWRVLFLAGLLLGGFTLKILNPNVFEGSLSTEKWTTVVAGLLVGFGTILGSGCTSGHGVCGISRMSPRSIAATLIFITSGVIAVALFRKFGVMP